MSFDQNGKHPFLTRDDLRFGESSKFTLIADIIAHDTTTLDIRGFTKDGHFTYKIIPIGDGSIETFTLGISDVPVGVSVLMPSDTTGASVTNCTLHLGVDSDRILMLGQGAVSGIFGISWPHQHPLVPNQSDGVIAVVPQVDGTIGQELTVQVPPNEAWKILSFTTQLDTSSTVADRTVQFNFFPDTGAIIRRSSSATQQASESIMYNLIPGGTSAVITANSEHEIGVPSEIILGPGDVISTTTTNRQAGDQFTNVATKIRRYYSSQF